MTQWADRWRMKLNPQKCNSIIIKKGASPTLIYYKSLYIHEEEIPKTDTITFLGLDIIHRTLNLMNIYSVKLEHAVIF